MEKVLNQQEIDDMVRVARSGNSAASSTGPVVQPWYLSWGLILLAPVALGQLRSLVIGLSMVTAFIELPGGTQLVTTLLHGDPLLIVLTMLWILVLMTVPLSSWDQRRPELEAERPTSGAIASA